MVKVRRLLEPFKRLRNVGNVEFVGCMKPEAAAVFKRIMQRKVGSAQWASIVKPPQSSDSSLLQGQESLSLEA
jgi:hypothetical protein